MKHHETTNQTKSPTLPLGRQLHFAKLLRHKSRHIMKLFPTLHLAAASDPVTGAAATVIRRLQGSAELQQQRHHRAVAFLGRHQQRRQTSGGGALFTEKKRWKKNQKVHDSKIFHMKNPMHFVKPRPPGCM